jgi:hypothetical protein
MLAEANRLRASIAPMAAELRKYRTKVPLMVAALQRKELDRVRRVAERRLDGRKPRDPTVWSVRKEHSLQ